MRIPALSRLSALLMLALVAVASVQAQVGLESWTCDAVAEGAHCIERLAAADLAVAVQSSARDLRKLKAYSAEEWRKQLRGAQGKGAMGQYKLGIADPSGAVVLPPIYNHVAIVDDNTVYAVLLTMNGKTARYDNLMIDLKSGASRPAEHLAVGAATSLARLGEKIHISLQPEPDVAEQLHQQWRAAARDERTVKFPIGPLPLLARFGFAIGFDDLCLGRAVELDDDALFPFVVGKVDRYLDRQLVESLIDRQHIIIVGERDRRDAITFLMFVHDQPAFGHQKDGFADRAVPDAIKLDEMFNLQPLMRFKYAAHDITPQPECRCLRRILHRIKWTRYIFIRKGRNRWNVGSHSNIP